jgi:hypothetical protein
MPVASLAFTPALTPAEISRDAQAADIDINVMPDGDGLLLAFMINGKAYIMAGTRDWRKPAGWPDDQPYRRLIVQNGGKIDDPQAPLWVQLVTESREETFGVMTLTPPSGDQPTATLNVHTPLSSTPSASAAASSATSSYELTLRPDLAHLAYADSFTFAVNVATCAGITRLGDLQHIVDVMNPTAAFYNRLGTFMYANKRPPSGVDFAEYWAGLSATDGAFGKLMSELETEYTRLMAEGKLLVEPKDVLGGEDNIAALRQLLTVKEPAALDALNSKIGDYSERSTYAMFDADMVLDAAEKGLATIKDTQGIDHPIAAGIVNKDAVQAILPNLVISAAEHHVKTTADEMILASEVAAQAVGNSSAPADAARSQAAAFVEAHRAAVANLEAAYERFPELRPPAPQAVPESMPSLGGNGAGSMFGAPAAAAPSQAPATVAAETIMASPEISISGGKV